MDIDRKRHATRRKLLAGAAASAAALITTRRSPAESAYPGAGPIRLIVPFAPAGPVDILARIIVDPLAKQLGQSVVIENRGGAGGNIAIAAAARAKPDGYTLLLHHIGMATAPTLYRKLPYDPLKDFAFITSVVKYPMVYAVRPDSPIASFKDMIDRAITDYDSVLRLDPTLADIHNARGELWRKKGDLPKAVADFRRRHQAEPGSYRRQSQPPLAGAGTGAAGGAEGGRGQAEFQLRHRPAQS